MSAAPLYYLILVVYLSLWSCEVIACHLTHSLVILTDSYINLYKILEVLLGIIHLKTQTANSRRQKSESKASLVAPAGAPAQRLFDRVCTYQFRRLPLLGSFVNKLFLAALLMSAAIEGIQTCFHASHSNVDGDQSILHTHPLTYPTLLTGFALVGLVMQWCATKIREIRDDELGRLASAWPAAAACQQQQQQQRSAAKTASNAPAGDCCELSADRLDADHRAKSAAASYTCLGAGAKSSQLPGLGDDSPSISQISLRSFTTTTPELTNSSSGPATVTVELISDNTTRRRGPANGLPAGRPKGSAHRDRDTDTEPLDTVDAYWLVGHAVAPAALVSCALIVYLIHNDLVTEIADAALAIMTVVVLFAASCPPMKKAGRVLLQSSPCDVNLDRLKQELLSVSEHLVAVKELHVWSLTSVRAGRVGTCQLVFRRAAISSERQLAHLLARARSKFASQHIDCVSVEPRLVEGQPAAGAAPGDEQ